MADDFQIHATGERAALLTRLLDDYARGNLGVSPTYIPRPRDTFVPFFVAYASATISPSCDGSIRFVGSTTMGSTTGQESVLSSCDVARDWFGVGASNEDKLYVWRSQQNGHLYFLNGTRGTYPGFTAGSSGPQIIYATPGGTPTWQNIEALPTYNIATMSPQSILIKTTTGGLTQLTPGGLYSLTQSIPFYDEFSTSAGTNLNDHTPDKGQSWTSIGGNSSWWEVDSGEAMQKYTGSGKIAASNPPSSSAAQLYQATPTAATVSPVEVSGNLTFRSSTVVSGEVSVGLACRFVGSSDHYIGALHVDNTGQLITFIYAKIAGTYSIKASCLIGQSTDFDFVAPFAGGPFQCKLRSESGSITFVTPWNELSASTDLNSTETRCGIYAETFDFFGSTGIASAVSVDNFEVRRL